MVKRIFRIFILTAIALSVFLLASCGDEKADDKLKADPIEQFNDSVKSISKVILGDEEAETDAALSQFSMLDFSIDDIDLSEITDIKIKKIAAKDGMLFINGIRQKKLSVSQDLLMKLYEDELAIYTLLSDGVTKSSIPFGTSITSSSDSYEELFNAFLIYSDDLKETVRENRFKLTDSYVENLVKELSDFGFLEGLGQLSDLKIEIDTGRYETENKIKFTFKLGEKEATATVKFEKANGIHTVKITTSATDEEEAVTLTLKTKGDVFHTVSFESGTLDDYISAQITVEEVKSEKKGLKKYEAALTVWGEDETGEFGAEGEALCYVNDGGAMVKLTADIEAKKDEETFFKASLKYDDEAMKTVNEKGLVISLEFYGITPGDLLNGDVTSSSAKDEERFVYSLSLKTKEYTEESSTYSISLKAEDGNKTKLVTATLSLPAKNSPVLTEKQKAEIEKLEKAGK